MGKFYNYDTRPASAADQIMTLERLLEEAEDAKDAAWRKGVEDALQIAVKMAEASPFVGSLSECSNRISALLEKGPQA